MLRNYCFLTLLIFSMYAGAQINISYKYSRDNFPICNNGNTFHLVVSANEEISVKNIVSIFADDIERVTSIRPVISNSPKGDNVIVIGTLGKNRWIDEQVAKGKLDVSQIKNGWEQYIIKVIDTPEQGIGRALVVVGSDRRGTAYGALHISEKIGVSPYYWWADVPVEKHSALYLSGEVISKTPSVKYRGIFINDEDWGLKPWSTFNYEKNLGDIGPKTYAKVCELVLRLRGNMLAPAMHTCTGAFYFHPDSKVVADSFGIVISTSHCEPLLINTAAPSEFNIKRDGDWNYATNDSVIREKWNRRMEEASQYENIYTVAMRGLHDAGLRGRLPMNKQVEVLTRVIKDQRSILTNHISKDIEDIPQIFVPYKETMDVFENGLQIPDDITLVWVDDNYGYIKRVSNLEEQKRKGGSGVYYHLSYLGAPHDYLWLNTTSPLLMYKELMKAYNTGADRYWLLNVGDIKPSELGMKTFFDLAWNVDEFDANSINKHQPLFLGDLFGKEYIKDFQTLLDEYYRLAWSRKPEFMGWEREWDDKEHTGLKDTEYSFSNYGEAQSRLSDYKKISYKVKSIMDKLPMNRRAAFFEMIAYPVMGSYQMNRKFLMAQLNHELLKEGNNAGANWAAKEMELSYDSISVLNSQYNSMLGGKWKGMMELAPGWCALYQNKPAVTYTDGVKERTVDLKVKSEKLDRCFVLDLTKINKKDESNGHKFSIIGGMGYDWHVLQLGEPTDKPADAGNINGDRVEYRLPKIENDSIEVTIYSVPFFPLYQGRNTDIGISVDGCTPQIFRNKFKEYDLTWKNQVLRNGAEVRLKFAINKSLKEHKISFICGEPGMMIEKVIIDWGGLKKSYLGPDNH